jgi:CarD family transcriptional regulator
MNSAFSPVDDDERVTSGLPKEPLEHIEGGTIFPEIDAPDALTLADETVIVSSEDVESEIEAVIAADIEIVAAEDLHVIDDEADLEAEVELSDDDVEEEALAPKPRDMSAGRPFSMKRGGGDEHRRLPDRLTPPPRPLADEEDFAEGDHVVYPTHGVGKVERIAIEDIAGHRLELIHITFEENRMKLRVPVAKARSAGLRKLATRKIFDEALAVLKGRARIKRTMWSRRAQEYEAKINSGDPMAIAEVVRDLHRNAGQPDQSFSERQIYEAAMDRLAAELAALDRTDKATAAIKLANFLKTLPKESAA